MVYYGCDISQFSMKHGLYERQLNLQNNLGKTWVLFFASDSRLLDIRLISFPSPWCICHVIRKVIKLWFFSTEPSCKHLSYTNNATHLWILANVLVIKSPLLESISNPREVHIVFVSIPVTWHRRLPVKKMYFSALSSIWIPTKFMSICLEGDH